MPKYQVSLKQGSRSVVNHIEAKSLQDLLTFYERVTTMKVVKVMRVEYEDVSKPPIDDYNYYPVYKGIMNTEHNLKRQIIVSNVKKTINTQEIANLIKTHLEVENFNVSGVICSMFRS